LQYFSDQAKLNQAIRAEGCMIGGIGCQKFTAAGVAMRLVEKAKKMSEVAKTFLKMYSLFDT